MGRVGNNIRTDLHEICPTPRSNADGARQYKLQFHVRCRSLTTPDARQNSTVHVHFLNACFRAHFFRPDPTISPAKVIEKVLL